MRLLSNKRGQVRVIEAFFASVLMLSSLALLPIVTNHASASDSVLSTQALNTMVSLDSSGHLADLVDAQDWVGLQNYFAAVFPPALWFNLTVLDENLTPLNSVLITSGGSVSDTISAADYLCVSTTGTYHIYTLRLQLAGLD
jgi:hypothetical protein